MTQVGAAPKQEPSPRDAEPILRVPSAGAPARTEPNSRDSKAHAIGRNRPSCNELRNKPSGNRPGVDERTDPSRTPPRPLRNGPGAVLDGRITGGGRAEGSER